MSEKQEEKKPVKGKAKQENLKQEAGPVMYIGPNLLSKGLKTYTVYKQEPAEIISSLQQEFKTINRLFVPVAAATRAMADLQKKGTPVNLAYAEMTK